MENLTELVSITSNLLLILVNIVFIYISKKTLDNSIKQVHLTYNPVIGIRIMKMNIGPEFGPSRRQMNFNIELTNVGNAPAIDVMIDSEVIFSHTSIKGKNVIPMRHQPVNIPFIKVNDSVEGNYTNQNFGNICVTHTLDDFRESERLNILRIETDPTKESYKAAKYKVYVYYKNNIGQYFVSTYETYLNIDKIPSSEESVAISQIYVPTPIFHSEPIELLTIEKELSKRDENRDLCGW